MTDYDVVIIGGGINGLTVAGYLAKAGLSVGVFEARGQCGAHCDTVELGLPGFLHNLHATWLATSLSPAMVDLDLEGFGLELRGTDVLYAKPFLNGKNFLQASNIPLTLDSAARLSDRDHQTVIKTTEYLGAHLNDLLYVTKNMYFTAPNPEVWGKAVDLVDGFSKYIDLGVSGLDLVNGNGFDLLELLFDSEEIRTTLASLSWIGAHAPVHRRVATNMLWSIMVAAMPVHTARGGSHALTHSLVKAVAANGGEIWTTCPVEKIIVENGRACGIKLAPDALLPSEEIRAKVVVSNLTLVPTFLRLLGEDAIGDKWARQIESFSYDDSVLFGVYYSLSGDPEFASAEYDPGIQRAMMGYWGGETLADMQTYAGNLASGIVSSDIMGNWFVPSRADPTQAPHGCATSFVWMDVPPCPRRWGNTKLRGWDAWPELAQPLADAITDRYEQYAPGFKELILERFVMTPMDQQNNNPSAVRGNMFGGSVNPEQYYNYRPQPGIVVNGNSRSFFPGLYLSNSTHPGGASWLASGMIAAHEIAQDLGCREQPWWIAEPYQYFMEQGWRLPVNMGVSPKWLPPED